MTTYEAQEVNGLNEKTFVLILVWDLMVVLVKDKLNISGFLVKKNVRLAFNQWKLALLGLKYIMNISEWNYWFAIMSKVYL